MQELEVVTGDGQIATCSDERNSGLFNAMLGGLGQCGIITKVVMRLTAAPTNVLFIKMDYDDFQSASADLALLAKDGRFHHLEAAAPAGRRRRRVLRRRRFDDAPDAPDEARLTAGLKFAKNTAIVMTYEQYFRREEVCGACTTPLQKPFVYLGGAGIALRRVHVWYPFIADGLRVSRPAHVGVASARHQAPAHPHAG